MGPVSMTFGEAIEAAKEGKRIVRAGWNGKGMWVCYMPPMVVPRGMVNSRTRAYVPDGGDLCVGGYFVMWTATSVWQPGWLASQSDMLAEDWGVAP